MRRKISLFLALLFCLSTSACAEPLDTVLSRIRLPPGFTISVYSDRTPEARSMTLGENGTVYVGSLGEGKVYALRDEDGDGRAERSIVVASGLNMPNGVAYFQGDLYIAEISRIVKLKDIGRRLSDPPPPVLVADAYPNARPHGWKYLRVGPDGLLYAPVGAPCNICLSEDPIFASLTRIGPDGKGLQIYAHGIRNTVGFDWHPETGELYFTDNGRDLLGDDVPPEELNKISQPGQDFGYPYCHGGDIPDPEFGKQKSCDRFTPPVLKFPAHVAPLGIHFYRGKQFPPPFRGQLFVAQHGSWNRSKPQGYRVSMVRFRQGQPVSEEIFAEGWLGTDGKADGRPVDVLELADGSLLVSDDLRGAVYRIRYQSP
ncbi:sorbosone dehydrogenase family protein [Methylococcus sp. EFPC2]|uniref:PQQ-dependent sugar dehydrogenase n=1 Tax=Methylococcus sp. EFPC2 TaxID=2812648 RepID=UPI001967AA23|nr:PQQ-dependent sugar dehydrogenase [Methylococcus sp. EFPC2]QSA98549.1 sorbosone dehydrogenase family protein [Methylococcus sp. EFPC2]